MPGCQKASISLIAEAYVTVSPDTDAFPEELKSQLEAFDFTFTVPVRPDAAGFVADAQADIRAQGGEEPVDIPVDPDAGGFREKLQAAVGAGGAGESVDVPVDPDAAGFGEKLQALVDAGEAGVRGQAIEVPLSPDAAGFDEKLTAAVEQARIFVTSAGGVTVPVYADAQTVSFERVIAGAQLLADAQPVKIPVDVNAAGSLAGVTALTAATDALGNSASRAYGLWGVLGKGIPLFAEQGVLGVTALFGGTTTGIMKTVAAWHLLADVAVEFSAVAIPAVIALGAFGVAAAGDIGDMYTHFENVLTITDALRTNMAPLTGGLTAMQNAVKPEVYQLAGEAIDAMTQKTGVFQTLAVQTGTVLDQLGARAEVAVTSSGMTVFLKNATGDLRELGNVGANVFGIIGNLLKSVPGYAQPLETFVQNTTGFLEAVTDSGVAQGAIKVGLAFHGAAIYIGLAATAADFLITKGLSVIPPLALKAATGLERLGGEGNVASEAMLNLGAGAESAAALPWAWITVAAAAIGVMAYEFVNAGDAADDFVSRVNAAVGSAPLSQTLSAINDGLSQTRERLSAASDQMGQLSGVSGLMGHALESVAPGLNDVNTGLSRFVHDVPGASAVLDFLSGSTQTASSSLRGTGLAAATAVHDYETYKAEITSLNQQGITFRTHLAALAVQFGGTAQAMGILTAAGITSAQMTSKSASSWAQVMAQVQATTVAYQDMGQQGGILGADMNALDIASSEQATAMSKLNQAWDSTIGIVSGGQNSLITFQQDLLSVNQAVEGTGGTGRVVTDTFAAAKKAADAAGASMTGLNAASLQLRSTWQTAYGGAETLVDSLSMMTSVAPHASSATRVLTQAMKDSIAELIPFGAQSSATSTELVQLAQRIDPNITNFTELTKWLGSTKDAGSNLNTLVAKLGGSLEDLTTDAGSLSASMQSDVTAQFDLARLAANGTDTAITNLANAMSKSGATARSEHPAMVALYGDLLKDGFSAQQAQSMIEAMTGQIFRIPTSHVTKITADTSQARSAISDVEQWIDGLHGKTVNITVAVAAAGNQAALSKIGLGVYTGATGGVIPGYAPGQDTVLAAVSPGEGMLVPEAVRGIGGPEAVHALNRKFGGARVARGSKTGTYASGGIAADASFRYPNDIFNITVTPQVTQIGLPPPGGTKLLAPYTTGTLGSGTKLSATEIRDAAAEGVKLANDFADAWQKTAKDIKTYTTDAISEITRYYGKTEASGLVTALRSQTNALEAIVTKYTSVTAEISAMKTYAANITSSLASATGLSAITAPVNATTGATGPVTGAYIKQQLAAQLRTLQQFFNAINKLSKDKLGKTLIAQVIALGPTEGLQYANAILAGGSTLARALASTEAAISKTETKIGQEGADIQYGQSTAKGFLSGLQKEQSSLQKEMRKLGDEIAKELARDLGVPLKDVKLAPAPAKKKEPEKKKDEKPPLPGKHIAKPDVHIHLEGSKGKLSTEELAGVMHTAARQLALAT
jgi:hypothetical protein